MLRDGRRIKSKHVEIGKDISPPGAAGEAARVLRAVSE
jgi:hypothetical protein